MNGVVTEIENWNFVQRLDAWDHPPLANGSGELL